MPTVVVPFRGVEGKSRLGRLQREARTALAHAMLADVLDASLALGLTVVVAPEGTPIGEAIAVADPGGGQGAAVRVGLDAAVAAGGGPPYLVVNADLPCVTARDLSRSRGAVPDGGLALAAAADGTTNALALVVARPLRAGLRARAAPLASPRSRRRASSTHRTWSTTSTRSTTSSGSARASAAHTRAALATLLGAAA